MQRPIQFKRYQGLSTAKGDTLWGGCILGSLRPSLSYLGTLVWGPEGGGSQLGLP